ncbi:hypothetical protein [Armatimonas rosea]|uniref:Methanolan biosynthesis EpsI domain-containing protein n=1 Tax=Armatimonas rosea TaxID=685828 RepID=A0A7W9SY01_ARMRO|nr:hypothetical protein [Armatimonas rosea]MBB6053983.1 hypothetical protein [Armatimonas rosea]
MTIDPQRIKQLGVCLAVFAAAAVFLVIRQGRNADWLLTPPLTAGNWEAIDTPLPQEFLLSLALPKAHGVDYQSPLDEHVTCQLIAPRSFEAYREPDMFSLLQISAQRSIPLFGPDKPIRAWVLKVPNQKFWVLCYAWLQTPSGQTSLFGERGLRQGVLDRLNLGWSSVVRTEPVCLVRLYCRIAANDKNGVQARRNLDLIARSLYEQNTKGGK